jgi:hypothetical protein
LYSGRFAEEEGYGMLFELYIFADKVDVPALKKDIMTFIHRRSHRRGSPDIKDATKAFQVLPKSCGLVRWLADRYANHEDFNLGMDREFGISVMAARGMGYEFICRNTTVSVSGNPCCNVIEKLDCGCDVCNRRNWEKTRKGDACAYHEHASIEEWKGKFFALHTNGTLADMIHRLCWR